MKNGTIKSKRIGEIISKRHPLLSSSVRFRERGRTAEFYLGLKQVLLRWRVFERGHLFSLLFQCLLEFRAISRASIFSLLTGLLIDESDFTCVFMREFVSVRFLLFVDPLSRRAYSA